MEIPCCDPDSNQKLTPLAKESISKPRTTNTPFMHGASTHLPIKRLMAAPSSQIPYDTPPPPSPTSPCLSITRNPRFVKAVITSACTDHPKSLEAHLSENEKGESSGALERMVLVSAIRSQEPLDL